MQEAAAQLGVTIDAIRGRIKRGTLRSTKDEDGTVYVFVEGGDQSSDQSETSHQPAADQPELVEVLKEQNDYLRRQLEVWQEEARRKDHIIAALAERIPAIEATSEAPEAPRDGSVTSPEASGNGAQGLTLRSQSSAALGCIGSSSGRDKTVGGGGCWEESK